jgi:cAMP-dependent protein kinase regulator
MEVTVVDTGDLPASTVISFHTGSIRRHAQVEKNKAINLSYVTGSEPIRVDLMSQVGSHTFDMVPGQDVYDVPINSAAPSSSDVKLKFQIRDAAAAADARAKKAAQDAAGTSTAGGGFDAQTPVSPSRKLQTALMMRSYLDNHDVLRQMQELLQDMVTNRPEDPIDYMIRRLEEVCMCSQDVELECLASNSSRIIMADVDVKVFGAPASPNVMSVVMIGMDAGVGGLEMIDAMGGAHKKPEYTAMNPFQRMPTLKDADYVIGESCASLRYIAMKYKPPCYPVNDPMTCGWIDFAMDSFVEDVCPPLLKVLLPVMGLGSPAENQAKVNQDCLAAMDSWRKYFLVGKFVCGDRPTIADFKVVPFLLGCVQPGIEKKTGFKAPDRIKQFVEDFCSAVKSSSMLKSAGGLSIAELVAANVPDAGTASAFTREALGTPQFGKPAGKVKIYGMAYLPNVIGPALLGMDAGVAGPGDWEFINITEGSTPNPEFSNFSPFGHVPCVRDGEFAISECTAALRYIAITYKPAYYPVNEPHVCGTIDFAMESFASDLYPKIQQIISPVMGQGSLANDQAKLNEECLRMFEVWSKQFLQGKFVAGDRLTIADFRVAPFFFACVQPAIESYVGFKAPDRIKKFVEDFCGDCPSSAVLRKVAGTSIADHIRATSEARQAKAKGKDQDEEEEEDSDDDDDVADLMDMPPPPVMKKRESVSAEAYGSYNERKAFQKKIVQKDDGQKTRIREVLSSCWMFQKQSEGNINTIVDAMSEKVVQQDVRLVSQGEDGSVMWVIEEGELECSKVIDGAEKVVKVCKRGDVFGELALLYNAPRAASVTSRSSCKLWELDRDTFKAVAIESAATADYEGFTAPGAAKAKEETKKAEDDEEASGGEDDEAQDAPAPVQKKTGAKRREGVSAEAMQDNADDWVPPVYEKSAEERGQLSDIIKTSHDSKLHMLFGTVNSATFEKILDATFLKVFSAGDHAIEQGDVGDYFYIVKSGQFDIIVKKGEDPPKKVFEAGAGFAFGELALLYNAPRSATITATGPAEVWCLDRTAFRNLVVRSAEAQFKEYVQFLAGVDAFHVLSDNERASLAEVLEEEEFEEDEAIVEQGERDDKMFILRTGSAVACIKGDQGEVEVKQYAAGDYFGEIALLSGEPRKASVYACGPATCLYISRETFLRILGPLQNLLERNMSKYAAYQDAIANAEPADSTPNAAAQDHAEHDDHEEFSGGGVNLQGKTKTKLAKKRERKTEEMTNIDMTGKKIEKADDEPATLADKVAQDFKNKALVDPSPEFNIATSKFWIYGGLLPQQKFTMDKLLHIIPGINAASEGEDEMYSWDSPTKLKNATQVAVICQKGQKSAADPTPNQDNFFIHHIGGVSMYGVCDGHGPFGHLVSFRLVQTLPHFLVNSSHYGKDWQAALTEAFLNAQKDLEDFCQAQNINIEASGAAGSVLVMEEQTIHIAFIGDARIMLGSWNRRDSRMIFETKDHKPENPGEKERLEAAGSEVREIDGGSHRIYLPGSSFPGLTMSRAFGDTACNGVLREPEYHKYLMQPSDEWYAIVASDGVWEFIEGEEATSMTAKKLRLKGARETLGFLVNASRKRWSYCCGDYCDDITAIMVQWNSHEKKSGAMNHSLTVRKPK